jgi:hypothetical protein
MFSTSMSKEREHKESMATTINDTAVLVNLQLSAPTHGR